MAWVRVKENEPIDSAIRRFKKQCEKAGVLHELRKGALREAERATEEEGHRGAEACPPTHPHPGTVARRGSVRSRWR